MCFFKGTKLTQDIKPAIYSKRP